MEAGPLMAAVWQTDARENGFIICPMLCYSYGTGNYVQLHSLLIAHARKNLYQRHRVVARDSSQQMKSKQIF